MAGEITVNGRKKLATLQKEFSEAFNYLFIAFIDIADKDKKGQVNQIDCSKSISEVRTRVSNEELSLNGRTLIKNIEKYFESELGIYCQIGVHNYQGKTLYIPTDDAFNNSGLTAANKWAAENGCSAIGKINLSGEVVVWDTAQAGATTLIPKVNNSNLDYVEDWSHNNEQVLIATGEWGFNVAMKYGIYECQNNRSFRHSKYMTFYKNGEIDTLFEIIGKPYDNGTSVNTPEMAAIKIDHPEYNDLAPRRIMKLKKLMQVSPILNDSIGKHGKSVPFSYGQTRYTTLDLFKKAKKTSELIHGIKEEPITLEEKGQNTVINPDGATIKLQWSTTEDFDIAVLFQTKSDRYDMVYFANRGNLDTYPYIKLDKDERGGAGLKTETILINNLDEIEKLAIIAWDYSNSGSAANFDKSDVQIAIVDNENFEAIAKLKVSEKSDSVCVASIENTKDGFVFTNISKNFMRKTDKLVMWNEIFQN